MSKLVDHMQTTIGVDQLHRVSKLGVQCGMDDVFSTESVAVLAKRHKARWTQYNERLMLTDRNASVIATVWLTSRLAQCPDRLCH